MDAVVKAMKSKTNERKRKKMAAHLETLPECYFMVLSQIIRLLHISM